MLSSTTLLLAGAGLAAAITTIPVSVGKSGLTFAPNVIHAQVGDVIEFNYWPLNHSVVAGDFSNACVPATSNGFFSGFFPTKAGTVNAHVFRVTVNHTNPIPIYCSQNMGQHCKNGMVAVINPAEVAGLTLEAYVSLARNAGNAVSPAGGPFGGVLAPNPATSSSASGGGSSTTSPTTASNTQAWSQPHTQTQCQSQTPTTTPSPTTTSAGTGGASSTATSRSTETGNTAAGGAVPFAGLVAVAVGALFV